MNVFEDILKKEKKENAIIDLSFAVVTVKANGEDFDICFRPKRKGEPVIFKTIRKDELDELGCMLSAAEPRPVGPKWDFVADEERYTDDGRLFWTGLLTNGENFLYWQTAPTENSDEPTECCIYNSILMTDDTVEVCYPWAAVNDEMVVNCLNSLDDPNNYCGDDSALLQLEFVPFEQCDEYDEYYREYIRRQMSPLLNDTDENNLKPCDIVVCDGLARIDSCYEIPGEGTIWFHFSEPGDIPVDEGGYANFDDLDKIDLMAILELLRGE